MTESEIISTASGEDVNHNNKSIIMVETKTINIAEKTEKENQHIGLDGPIVNIIRSIRFVTVDIQYASDTDYDLVTSLSVLQSLQSDTDDDNTVSTIQVTIIPKEFDGNYYLCGINPAWCVMPSKPGKPFDTIRFIFVNDDFGAYQINNNEEEKGHEEE